MKIKPWDGYVIRKFYEFFAIIATLFSIWVAFFPISDETRKISGIVFLGVCVAIYAGVLVFANLTQKVELKIGNTKIVIRVGDIWEASGKKVIPMNEYYDTENNNDEGSIAEVIVAKNRHGSTGNIKMGWIGRYTKFRTIATNIQE